MSPGQQAEAARTAAAQTNASAAELIASLGGWKQNTDTVVAQASRSVDEQLRQLRALQYALEHTRTFMFSEDNKYQRLAGTPFEVRVPDVVSGSTLSSIQLRVSDTREELWSRTNWQLGESQQFKFNGKQYVIRFSLAQDHASPFSDYFALELVELGSAQQQQQQHARVAEAPSTRPMN